MLIIVVLINIILKEVKGHRDTIILNVMIFMNSSSNVWIFSEIILMELVILIIIINSKMNMHEFWKTNKLASLMIMLIIMAIII